MKYDVRGCINKLGITKIVELEKADYYGIYKEDANEPENWIALFKDYTEAELYVLELQQSK
jgi:hypothetical protein